MNIEEQVEVSIQALNMPNHQQKHLHHEVDFQSANNHPTNHQPSANRHTFNQDWF